MKISVETIRLKFRNKFYIPITCRNRRKKLKVEDFTIISNNCWGGTVYESYGLRKNSPTIGMFIMPEDYLNLISNLDYYLSMPLKFIEPEESKWCVQLEQKSNWKTYVIGVLGDVELHMLHYHDKNIAIEKWNKRIQRINRERIIFKFNDQNGCTVQQIKRFIELPLENKICFVASEQMKITDDIILVKQPKVYQEGIKASREPFGESKYFNITEYINNLFDK